ncbi:hypothetical protein ACVWWO_009536 [Bradyrhizobium sp. F1.13.1]
MKLVIHRGPARPHPAPLPVPRQTPPALGPHHVPVPATPPTASNEVAAHAVRTASSPGGIDPRQHWF